MNDSAGELDEKRPGQVSVDNRGGSPRPRAEHQCAEAEEQQPWRHNVQPGRHQRPETEPAVLAGGARPGSDPGHDASRSEEEGGESQPCGEPRRAADGTDEEVLQVTAGLVDPGRGDLAGSGRATAWGLALRAAYSALRVPFRAGRCA